MVWKKKSKLKRFGKQNLVLDSHQQQNLKSCLKASKDVEESIKSSVSTSRKSNKSGSSSGNSSSIHSKRILLAEQKSISSTRSWDRESWKSTTQSTQTSEQSIQKRVRFHFIYIRDYERVVGDNPSCTTGPPVGIGWSYGKTRVIDVNRFEQAKLYKKSPSHLVLSREEREALLLNWGASFHDIIEAVRSNIKIKNQRRQTVTNLGKVERIEEAFESATRKLKSALMLRRSTGNKVRRLQEQANLAQSALTSLKIAEDRALSEIRGTRRRVLISDNKRKNEELKKITINSSFSPDPVDGLRSSPEEDDLVSKGFSLGNNSVTQSELEIERFYRELELEMFGDEELPSMVGQTLEVPVENNFDSNENYRNDFDDALLEQERDRSMISQYLLEDAMFEDYELLGIEKCSYREKMQQKSSRSRKDMDAGPKVQFIPLPSHFSPARWMDDSSESSILFRGHDTMTILEDNYDANN